ncbi:larval cuticle protein LCP-17-like [Pectinophora gossypiella]|uniref:larval cuticle protein LCP-17-like n=1 Tax=Pectinophora gossypiella TaxID=13191 RepID=UPI00214E976F|nr:larval cuticle protein LCP-17-like [Pectinophora gossypiella]
MFAGDNMNRDKFLIIALAVACAHALPDVSHLRSEADVPIVRSNFDVNPDGSYQYAYETGNGIAAQAEGVIKNPNSEYPALEVQGQVKYTSPEGEPISLTYVANENGYQPQGSHIHPVPEAIARSLAWIESHPPSPSSSSSFGPAALRSLVGR